MNYYMGLDVGGTSGRVRVLDEKGNVLGEYEGIGCAYNTDGPQIGHEKYTRLLQDALTYFELRACECLGVCCAASGVDSEGQEQSLTETFEKNGFPKDRILVVNDCEVLLYLSEGPALVAIAGTGSICFGRDSREQVYRTGGWNHVLSDEGSAFGIGLDAFKMFAEFLDGRNDAKTFAAAIGEATGVRDLAEADNFVNEHLFDKRDLAKLSVLCAGLADAGDPYALSILRRNADKVYQLIYDTRRKMTLSQVERVDVWLWGSVAVKNAIFQERLRERILSDLPTARIGIPDRTALEIAASTARKHFAP